MRGFYGCYLLQSQSTRSRGKTYIGFTVNPKRRIRQHNGEIGAGAWKTKSGRPWSMVLVVYGFPTKVQALQFEWAWQHPEKSKAVREDVTALVASCKRAGLSGAKGKIKLLMLLLNSQQWRYYPLTVQVLSTDFSKLLHGVASPPDHVSILYGPAEVHASAGTDDEIMLLQMLPTVVADDFDEGELRDCDSESEAPAAATCDADASISAPDADGPSLADSAGGGQPIRAEASEEAEKPAELDPKLAREAAKLAVRCAVCEEPAKLSWLECPSCTARAHLPCLASHFIQSDPLQPSMPARGPCPMCGDERTWAEALLSERHIGWAGRRSGRVRTILKADPKLKRVAASRKPRASSSGSRAPEKDAESQGQAAETSTKPKRSGGGRKRATSKEQVGAPKEGHSQSAAAADQADINQGSRHLQEEASAQAGDDPKDARSTAIKAKKPPRRRKALVRVAPVSVDSDAGPQIRPSTAGHSSARGVSKAAGRASQVPPHGKALAGERFVSSHCDSDALLPITEVQSSQRSAVCHASSTADEVAGGSTAAQAGQLWALPAQDAWCYIASSPELSTEASPELAACRSFPRHPHFDTQRIGKLDSSSKGLQMQPSDLARSSQAGSSLQKPISLLSSDSEDERDGRQGPETAPGAVAGQEKLGKRCRSTRKGAGVRGAAPKSPRACPGRAPAASAATRAAGLASAAGHLGAEAFKETPIASKLAGKLQLGCSQEGLAEETVVECSPSWLPSPAPLRRRLEGTLAVQTALGSAQQDVSRVDLSTAVIDIDLS